MSISHMDNFSIYGTTTSLMLNGIYAEVGGESGPGSAPALSADPDGVSGGKVLKMTLTTGALNNYTRVRYALQGSPQPVVGVAQRVWLENLPPDDVSRKVCPVNWRDASNNPLFAITINPTGRLEIRSGNHTGTVLATTAAPVIISNAWLHLESRLTIAGASGNVQVRVEGATVLDVTLNTGAVNIAGVSIINDPDASSAGTIYYVKDYVIWDGLGSTNNNFLGSVIVTSLLPDSDVALNWAPTGAANGYSILDNIPPTDAAFITAITPPPAPYQATLTNLPPDVTSVKALMTIVRAAKTDGGDGSLQISVVSGASTGNGTNRPITVAQTYWRDIFEIDPATSAAWLPTAVDAAQLKINRTL